MIRKISIIGLFLLGTICCSNEGHAAIAPHNRTNDIHCVDCHLPIIPVDPDNPLNRPFGMVDCTRCHWNDTGANYTRDSAPAVETHSSDNIGSTRYGEWSRECQDCHGHNWQDPLVEGAIADPVVDSENKTTTFSLKHYMTVDPAWSADTVQSAPENWGSKTGSERGLLIVIKVPSESSYSTTPLPVTAEIISATENSITVKGVFPEIAAEDIIIIYGQMLSPYLDPDQTDPIQFNSPNEFAHNDFQGGPDPDYPGFFIDSTPDGVCQVCHTNTKYWRKDGTASIHYVNEQCTKCHDHKHGFRPNCDSCHGFPPVDDTPGPGGLVFLPSPTGSLTSGQHQKHLEYYSYLGSNACDLCHVDGMPVTPVVDDYKIQIGFDTFGLQSSTTIPEYDGQILENGYSYEATNGAMVKTPGSGGKGTMQCSNVYCHSPARTPSLGYDMPSKSPPWDYVWPDPSDPQKKDFNGNTNPCDNCHGYPPSFDSHGLHWQMGEINKNCGICHYATTTDGVTISNPAFHANGQYDVVPAPGFMVKGRWRPLEFYYAIDEKNNKPTCYNNSCHMYARSIVKVTVPWFVEDPIIIATLKHKTVSCDNNSARIQVSVYTPTYPKYAPPFICEFDWGDGSPREERECMDQKFRPYDIFHTYTDGQAVHTIEWSLRDTQWSASRKTMTTVTSTCSP